MHPSLKQPLERALSSSGVTWITRRRLRAKRLILAYHGVIPDGAGSAGERGLFISQRQFAEHLDLLLDVADVSALTELDAEGDGRPRVAITIDDAYLGAVCEGVDELAARSLPATVFVAPGRLGGQTFWWDALAHATGKLDARVRNHALESLGGSEARVRAWAALAGLPVSDGLPDYAHSATTAQLHAALAHTGITFASHTWSHSNLASLSADEIFLELERSRGWLKAEFGANAIDWLAYPYGLDSSEAHEAAAALGYVGALKISGGWHAKQNRSRFARPRLNVSSNLSAAGLRARLFGVVRSRAGRQ